MLKKLSVQLTVTENGKKAPEYTLESDINGEISLKDFFKFTKNSLIQVADNAKREEQAAGFDKNPITIVDNSKNKPVYDVKPLGKIEYVTRDVGGYDLFLNLYDNLVKNSPIDTGHYKDSHVVMLNGEMIASNRGELQAWVDSKPQVKKNSIFRFFNMMPYSGKLEREGITGKRRKLRMGKSRDRKLRAGPMVRNPNGAYYLGFKAFNKRFKNNFKIWFEFFPAAAGQEGLFPKRSRKGHALRYTYAGAKANDKRNYKRKTSKRTGHAGPYVFPSIVIWVNEEGVI